MSAAPSFRVLGPVRVEAADGPVLLPPQETLVVAALLAARGLDVERDTLCDLLYGRPDPAGPEGALAAQVYALGESLRDRGLPWLVRRTPFRWRLEVPAGSVDADRLGDWADAAVAFESTGHVDGSTLEALARNESWLLDRPLDGLVHPWFVPFRDALAQRQAAAAARFAAACVTARAAAASVPLLDAMVRRPHLRGHRDLWEQLAVAHLGTGDDAAALDATARGHAALLDLGRTQDAHWIAGLGRRIREREPALLLRATGRSAAPPPARPAAPTDGDVEIGVLGPVRVVVDGRTVTPRRVEQQLLLARLAVEGGRPVEAFDLLQSATGLVESPPRAALRVADELGDLTSALRTADPDRARLVRAGTTFALHLGPGVLDLDRFRADRNAAMEALDAGETDGVVDRLDAACRRFRRPALEHLPGRWAQDLRRDLEVEALEVHAVLADRLRRTSPSLHADRLVELHERFSPVSTRLWAAILQDRRDAGADEALAALVREAPYGLGPRLDEDLEVRAMLASARRHLAAGGVAAFDVGWVFPFELRLFGPFRLLVDGVDRTPRQPGRVATLAALVVERNRPVPWEQLARAGWPGRPVDDLREDVRREVLALTALASSEPPRVEVAHEPGGWALLLPDPCTDLDRVDALAARGDELLAQGRPREAAEQLTAAVTLCAAPPLEDLPGPWFDPARRRLETAAERVAVLLATALVDGVLAVKGAEPQPALDRLEALVRRHPGVLALRERLMTGYHLCGRDRDAAAVHELATALGPAFAGPAARLMTELRATLDAVGPVRSGVSFGVLDGVRVEVLGHRRRPGRRARRTLAALLLRRRAVLPAAELVTAVRGAVPDDAAADASRLVEETLGEVEGATRPRWGSPDAAEAAARRSPLSVRAVPGGWSAVLPADHLDLDVVEALDEKGAAAWRGGQATVAADSWRAVLRRIPDRPLPDLDGPWFDAERSRLVAWRAAVVARCVEAELACGRYADALPDLERLAAAAPHDETVAARLVGALVALGRRRDARAAYERCAAALRRTLGTSPGPALQMLVRSLLDDA